MTCRTKIRKDIRQKIWAKYGFRCAYCGEFISYKDMQIDHIIPLGRFEELRPKQVRYSVNSKHNLNPSCRVCNHWKGVWTVDEFRKEIFQQTKRVPKYSSGLRIALKYGLIKILKTKSVKFFFEKT